jgi:hypothetical protein
MVTMMDPIATTTTTNPATRRDRMRLSLFYVTGYLTMSGLGFVFAPRLTLDMMFSTGHYDLPIVRMCGLFIIGLAVFVVQTIRHRIVVLYPAIIGVRVIFCVGYVVLYAQTGDPFFLAVLGVVGAGLLASVVCTVLDRRSSSLAQR